MYVHEGARLCFLANPRTASRAVAKALLGVGFEMVGSHHSGLDPELSYRAGVVFTTVRDVSDTLESWARKMDCDVPTFMRKYWPTARNIIEGWPDRPWTLFPHAREANVLLPYADLAESLNHLLRIHGVAPVRLEQVP